VLKIQTKLSSVFRHQKFLPVLTPSPSYEERELVPTAKGGSYLRDEKDEWNQIFEGIMFAKEIINGIFKWCPTVTSS